MECISLDGVTTLADDRHRREDRPRLLFSFWVSALRLKLLRWIASINNVTSLTGLEVLEVETNDSVLLNSSGLLSLTKLTPYKSPMTCFPTSLLVCELVVKTDLDLSWLTNLTSTRVELPSAAQLEFPTQLKGLGVDDALQLGRTKMSRVQLDCFECFGSNHSVTEEVLWMHLNCVFCVTRTAVKSVSF